MKLKAPFGPIWLDANEHGLTKISFEELDEHQCNSFTKQAADELTDYFLGKRTTFTVSLSIQTGTVFQRNVWQALTQIPYGTFCTYLDIANAVGSPKASRAIGQANSKNPIPIIIPCHRVIGKNGQLTGYLGSAEQDGLLIKKSLLDIEQITL
jgi:methylated-DNA-[protein]-cysteine S-methyltransferase